MWKWSFFTGWSATERQGGRDKELGCGWLWRGRWDDEGGGEGGGALCCAALCAGGSSCPAAVLLGSPSVWQAANHSAGKQCHFSSVCQNEQGREEIQRCKEDEGREAWGEADRGERDERRRRWKWEEAGGEKEGEADGAASAPPDGAAAACTISSELRVEAKHSCSCISVQGKNQREYLHADESQSPLHLAAARGKANLAFPLVTSFVTCHFPE